MLRKLRKYHRGELRCSVELAWMPPGTLHHVIVRGIERRRIVSDVADRKIFVKRLGELAVSTKTDDYDQSCAHP